MTVDVSSLLTQLRQQGIEIEVHGNKLALTGRKSLLTDDVLAVVREHKNEIIAALSRERQTPTEPPTTDAVPGRPCPCCGGIRFWQRPDGGWCCSVCHPAPVEGVPEIVVLRDLKQTLQRAVFELAEAVGWPKLPLDECRTIIGTRSAWVAFGRTADVPTLRLAVDKLREVLLDGEGLEAN